MAQGHEHRGQRNERRNPYLADGQVQQIDISRKSSASTPYRGQTTRGQTARGQVARTQSTRPQATRPQADRRQVNRTQPARTPMNRQNQSQAARRKREMQQRREAAQRRTLLLFIAGIVVIIILLFLVKQLDKVQTTGNENNVNQDSLMETGIIDSLLQTKVQGISKAKFDKHPKWEENFLTLSENSRPGEAIETVKNIFVHYTANPGTSARQNRSYFENLKDTEERSASAHFIIGYDGEIIQCVPLDEIAYAVQTRNYDSISVECCYKAQDGSFTQETYDTLIELLSWLIDIYELDSEDILRHYDCGGKKCPLYYTENEDAWRILKKDVKEYSK